MIVRADVSRRLPFRSKIFHACITSPPYYGLRAYDDVPPSVWGGDPACRHEWGAGSFCADCGGWRGCLGLEPTPDLFVRNLAMVFREVRRVLRDDGLLFLNMGDSYASKPPGCKGVSGSSRLNGVNGESGTYRKRLEAGHGTKRDTSSLGIAEKNLLLIPYRLAMALQADGWYVRSLPPWIKGSAMPESVEDRPHVAHEAVILLSKGKTYYYDPDAVRRPSAAATLARDAYTRITSGKDGAYAVQHDHETPSDPGGRHWRTADFTRESLSLYARALRDQADEIDRKLADGGLLTDLDGGPLAFLVNATPFKGAHYAVMPMTLAEQAIAASTSERGCCPACSAPWRRMTEREGEVPLTRRRANLAAKHQERSTITGGTARSTLGAGAGGDCGLRATITLGWQPSCPCDAGDPVPALVFDPFGGSGTAEVAARRLGRRAVVTDISGKYTRDARARLMGSIYDTAGHAAKDDPLPLFG